MGRPERPLDETGGPVAEFARGLRELRRRAGNPSYRELAQRALFVPSVLSSAAAGHRLPTLPVTLAFVAGCGGDTAAWERRWHTLAGDPRVAESGSTPDAGPDTGRGRRLRAPAAPGAEFAAPAQLPPGPGSFVGRAPALARVRANMGRAGLKAPILVCGPVGAGKTAFALQLADGCSAEFPDGQLYADLSGCGPGNQSSNAVMRGFLRALGVQDSLVPDNPMHRIGLYRSLLARRRLFVLLENPGDESQVRPLLARTTHSLVVVTGRGRLLGIEGGHRVELGPFDRAESVALLRRAAGPERAGPGGELETVAALCGDLPLALAVIGRRLAARPEWTLAHVAGLLADGEHLLDALRAGDESLRDRLDSAYRPLPAASRRALCRLGSAGAGRTTVAELAAALDVGEHVADDLLESLVDAGLLARADAAGHYRVPALVGRYAASLRGDPAAGSPDRRAADAEAVRRSLRHPPRTHALRR